MRGFRVGLLLSIYFCPVIANTVFPKATIPKDTCASIKGPCSSNPCQNGGECHSDSPGHYTCDCTKTYFIGPQCEQEGPCFGKPCMNGGKCIPTDNFGKYRCECVAGYIGFSCAFKDPCDSTPCHHNGTCIKNDESGNYFCSCEGTIYIGRHCDYEDQCLDKPCKNGGLCTTNSVGNYQCICPNDYTGTDCETKVDTCESTPCDNDVKCRIDENKHVKCCCGKTFVGEYCETKVTCDNNPCENNGDCDEENGGYKCVCGAGYSGTNCEIVELACDQDITTELVTEVSTCDMKLCTDNRGIFGKNGCSCRQGTARKGENCENKVDESIEKVTHPVSKAFCPVVSTIGERAGCMKCYAGRENCVDCCNATKTSCDANCELIKKITAKDPSPKTSCEAECSTDQTDCIEKCKSDDPLKKNLPKCPNKIYNCPSAVPEQIKPDEYQCKALKYPSGKISCLHTKVTTNKKDYHSYIMFPRINFAGSVQIDSATLNNIFSNFDIKTFSPSDTRLTNENWNPSGSSEFRFVNVSVTRVCQEKGSCYYLSHDDALAEAPIADQANGKVAAKIVDLDIEVQGRVSEIYGLSLDIGGFFKGDMERASFQSLWYKMIDEPNDDYGEGTRLQSVLTNVQFSEKRRNSPIVEYFRENIGPNQKLSICFNIDMMGEHPSANFSYARIVGSIGLAGEKAPHFFDFGRLLRRLPGTTQVNNAPFMVDEDNSVYVDLGNALGINRTGNILSSVGQLALGTYLGDNLEESGNKNTPNCLGKISWLSRIYYNEYGGYCFTAGIIALGNLKVNTQLDKQFVLAKIDDRGECQKILLAEHEKGINVRQKSHFVFRAEHGEVIQGSLFVTTFGNPATKGINLKLKDISSVVMRDYDNKPSQRFVIFPDSSDESIYHYYFYAKNKIDGIRKIIDGQVYALQYTYDDYPINPDRNEAMNSGIFIHVYDEKERNPQPTWRTDILPIFQVYANLFPVMRNFLDLADYNSVVQRKCHIITSMSLDFQDPQFMPVTRDLSSGKTKMILNWLDAEQPEFGLTHEDKLSKQHLLDLLQTALQLEHATLPIYLNGFLSIKPWQNQEVKKLLHGIIVEEMFHFAQVANIINGLGGRPYILGKTFVPAFPSHLPGGCRPNMIASINKISNQQIHDVYMEIEEPSYVLKEHELVALINKISGANLQPHGFSKEAKADIHPTKENPVDNCKNKCATKIKATDKEQCYKKCQENTVDNCKEKCATKIEATAECKDRCAENPVDNCKKKCATKIEEECQRMCAEEHSKRCAQQLDLFPIPNHKITERNHDTIGDLYMTVVYLLGQLSICGSKDIFTGKTKQLKWSDPKHIREVRNYWDAMEAIKGIVEQGEGASPYNPLEQNIHSPELAHYFKFSSIYHGRHIATFNVTNDKVYNNNKEECHENYVYVGDKISFFESGVWPVVYDPQMSKYKPGSQAYKNAQAYNDMYRRLLETLQSVFDGNINRFDDTFGLMKSLMVYGSRVVQTPIEEGGDPNIGPNAGPTYFN